MTSEYIDQGLHARHAVKTCSCINKKYKKCSHVRMIRARFARECNAVVLKSCQSRSPVTLKEITRSNYAAFNQPSASALGFTSCLLLFKSRVFFCLVMRFGVSSTLSSSSIDVHPLRRAQTLRNLVGRYHFPRSGPASRDSNSTHVQFRIVDVVLLTEVRFRDF